MHDLDLPRVAMYSTWGNTQDVGWVRYAFDKFEVPYDLIYKERVREGNLQERLRRDRHPEPGRGSGQAAGVRHRVARQADRLQEERAVQEPRDVRRVRRHHRRHGPRRASPSSTSSSNAGGVLITLGRGELLPRRVRPHAEGRRRADHRRSSTRPAPIVDAEILQPEQPDLLRLRQEDDAGALRQRSAADRADRREPVRRSAGDAAADAAGRADALSRAATITC